MTVAQRFEPGLMRATPIRKGRCRTGKNVWPSIPTGETELCQTLVDRIAAMLAEDPNGLCLVLTDQILAVPVTEWITDHLPALASWATTDERMDALTRFHDTALQSSFMRSHLARSDHMVLCIRINETGNYRYLLTAATKFSDRELEFAFAAADMTAAALRAKSERAQVIALQTHVLSAVAGLAEPRTRTLAGHVLRVGLLAEFVARTYGFPDDRAEAFRLAAPLHDLGKLCMPLELLYKSEALTDTEWQLMREHAKSGQMLLAHPNDSLHRLASEIAGSHHENWDGSGYPNGLRGTEIPLAARIVALVDVYDALRSERCYKPEWPESEARGHIVRERGRKFDPVLVDLLLAHWQEAEQIREATRWPTPAEASQ